MNGIGIFAFDPAMGAIFEMACRDSAENFCWGICPDLNCGGIKKMIFPLIQ